MSIHQRDILFLIKNLSNMDTALEMLIELERTMDHAGVFAYRNWDLGELVEGPAIDRYWFTTTWMYPRRLMPDPDGGVRLLKYDCRVSYAKDVFIEPVRVLDPEKDLDHTQERPRSARMRKVPVWLVTIHMPRRFVDDSHEGVFEISGEEIDVSDIQDAWEGEEFDSEESQKDNMDQAQDAAPDTPEEEEDWL